VRVHGNTAETRTQAAHNYFFPLADAMNDYGLKHIAEIADAARQYSLRGCPFQAWSLGEFVRLKYDILKLTT
jgi:glycogen debranching enzyme